MLVVHWHDLVRLHAQVCRDMLKFGISLQFNPYPSLHTPIRRSEAHYPSSFSPSVYSFLGYFFSGVKCGVCEACFISFHSN